jgi:hypothetical protein
MALESFLLVKFNIGAFARKTFDDGGTNAAAATGD